MVHPLIGVLEQPGLIPVRQALYDAGLPLSGFWNLTRMHPRTRCDVMGATWTGALARCLQSEMWCTGMADIVERARSTCFAAPHAMRDILRDLALFPCDDSGAVLTIACRHKPCHAFVQQLFAPDVRSHRYALSMYMESRDCCGDPLQAIKFAVKHIELAKTPVMELLEKSIRVDRPDIFSYLMDTITPELLGFEELLDYGSYVKRIYDRILREKRGDMLRALVRPTEKIFYAEWYSEQSAENRELIDFIIK